MSELNVQVEEVSPVVRRVSVQVPPERVAQVTDSVYARLGRTVKLRGYRQGRVPRRVLEKHFADQVRNDIARELVDRTFPEALGTTKLAPVAAPTVEPSEVKPGETFSYTARVEVRPEVELKQYKGLEVAAPAFEVTDAQVDARLEQLRDQLATVVPVEGRDTLELGDLADISYEVNVPGEEPQKRDDALVRIEEGKFVDGHGGMLAGAKIGETRTFEETFDADAGEQLEGKTASISATVKGIKKREAPALDDEFAKDVGGVDTLDGLKAKIREDLTRQAEEQTKSARRDALIAKLIELNPVEVPPALVDNMAEQQATRLVYNLARQGLRMPDEQAFIERLKRDGLEGAARQVRSFFLLDAVAKAENLEPTSEEIEQRFIDMSIEEQVPVERVKSRFRTPQALMDVIGSVRSEKALAFLETEATFTKAEPPKSE